LISPVYAKEDSEGRGNSSKKNASAQQEDGEGFMSPKEAAKARNTIRKLNKIVEEVDDPEVDEEVTEMAEEQEAIEEEVEETTGEVDKRSDLTKFLIGPDYRNLGQLRKQVVHTRNNVKQLVRLREKAGESYQELFDGAIYSLKAEASGMQTDIISRSSGFSLFGWLSRWLTGYEETEVPVEPTPEPTGETSITPGEEVSPTETETPSVTMEPTEEPTVSPEVTP